MIDFDFDNTDYAEDFEAVADANEVFDWLPEYRYGLWLKAYDTSCRETDREIELDDDGYAFDCYVHVLDYENKGKPVVNWYEPRAAKTREEAENVLAKMAEDIAKDKNIVEHLKKVVEVCDAGREG